MRGAMAAMALVAWAGAAGAGDLRVQVLGVRSDEGRVLVAVCARSEFLRPTCDHAASAPSRAGTTEVVVSGVPAGLYALQAVHDENGNRDLDRNRMGIPTEGFGFSRDAPLRLGPPRFADAAVEVGADGGALAFAMRYF